MPLSDGFDAAYKPGQGSITQLLPAPLHQNVSLSYVQERLWLLEQWIPGMHNCYSAIQLTGKLKTEVLERSLSEIIRRHESLRTTFKFVDGQLVQEINQAEPFLISVVDLIPRSERESHLLSLIHETGQRPFELDRDLLIRGTLLRIDEENHILILTWHYMICDGWSIDILSQELEELYNAFSVGKPSPLRELSTQYVDFAYWQRHQPIAISQEANLSHWKQQLKVDLPPLQLPKDHFSTGGGFQSEKQTLMLPNSLTAALKELSRREGSTLPVILLAAFKTLLYRYTGQDDFIIGYPTSNRGWIELKGLIGCFLNNLILRANLSGNPTFRELLGRVRQIMLEAYTYQDLPFELLVKEVKLGQYDRYDWPFQVGFVHQEAPIYTPKLLGLNTRLLDYWTMPEPVDLTLCTVDSGSELELTLGYNAELFDKEMVKRMLQHLDTLLQGIVKNPDERISTLPILSEDERHLLLVEWNNTHVNYPKDLCLHQGFEAQVGRTPDNIAVVCEDVQLTYRELNRRANQLAHLLQDLGVRPGEFVGLCMKCSAELAIGILGILKAGGACLLLNPALPEERRQFMLDDAKVAAVLAQSSLKESLLKYEANVIHFDLIGEALAKKSEENLDSAVTADHAACVVYTSGSTGNPKGVVQTHRSASSSFFPETALCRLTETDVFLVTTYNLLMPDIFWAWLSGARAIIPSDEEYRDSAYLVRLIAEKRVTFACFFSSMLQLLLEEEKLDSGACLRRVISMGEPLSVDLQERFFARLRAELYNAYGQAEAGSTIWKCEGGNKRGSVPVGRPAANVQIYLLDAYLQPVPIGVPGEIFISSANMAREYLNRPDLTGEKFIPNPFSNEPGAVLCKTGDFGRYLPDGNIEFLGRKDDQVKVRGFRVELREIEVVLSRYPAVLKTVVIAREDIPGNKRLVAYVVPVQGQTPTISELRRFLKEKLPDYMVPAAFVLLDALPLLPNGKVDRLALPAPNQTRPELEVRFIAPRTPIEQEIADIWTKVLGLEQVGVHDNFFDLGGHSLLAAQLASRLAEAFGVDLSLRRLFEAPTVADLAYAIETSWKTPRPLTLPPILPIQRHQPLRLSPAQQNLWLFDHIVPGTPFFNIELGVHMKGQLETAILERTLNELVERHEALRAIITVRDSEPVQEISDARCSLPLVDLRQITEPDRMDVAAQLVRSEIRRPFDLANGPLLRASLLRLADDEHLLVLTFHHIIADGWSIAVFWRELTAIYKAIAMDKDLLLLELPFQFADFAHWQRRCLHEGTLNAQLIYWQRKLDPIPPQLPLPGNRVRPSKLSSQTSRCTVNIPSQLYGSLKQWSRKEQVTLFMTLLSAFAVVLHNFTGQEDIAVGTLAANRSQPGTEGVFGLFVNTLILRCDLSGNPTFRDLVQRIREVVLNAWSNQDIPFEELVQVLERARGIDRSRLFQVMLSYKSYVLDPVHLPNLTIRWADDFPGLESLDLFPTSFDLIFEFDEKPGVLSGTLTFKTSLFDSSTIDQILKYFQETLEHMIAEPDWTIAHFYEHDRSP